MCPSFRSLAARTWTYLTQATATGVRISEETLTDINLIDLQVAHPGQVTTTKFPKSQEKLNGADWEWFIFAAGKFLTLRIQAKRLYVDGRYGALRRAGAAQPKLLIDSCRAPVTPTGAVPLYCFYNYEPIPAVPVTWPLLGGGLSVQQMGCALASAYDVQAVVAAAGAVTAAALAGLQRPWCDLVCPGASPVGTSKDGGLPALRNRLVEWFGEDGDAVPELADATDAPHHAQLVRTGEGEAFTDEVPARRVTVIDLDQTAVDPEPDGHTTRPQPDE